MLGNPEHTADVGDGPCKRSSTASGGEGLRCWEPACGGRSGVGGCSGRREPADGFGLVFRAPGALQSPPSRVRGGDLGFWEPCENHRRLWSCFPSLRKGMGWGDIRGVFKAEIVVMCAYKASFLTLTLGLLTGLRKQRGWLLRGCWPAAADGDNADSGDCSQPRCPSREVTKESVT